MSQNLKFFVEYWLTTYKKQPSTGTNYSDNVLRTILRGKSILDKTQRSFNISPSFEKFQMMEIFTTMEESFIIQNPVTLKALADPLRMEIMRLLKTPATVKELGTALHKSPTKLYYHVNMLEKSGVIQVVETNIVSGIIEKKYRIVARSFQISDSLLSDSNANDESNAAFLQTIFGITQTELKRSIKAKLLKPKQTKTDDHGLLFRSNLNLTEAQFNHFSEQLEAILKELDDTSIANDANSEGTRPFAITVAYYPVAPLES
jgi:DNA-binding transcriptional ArsR family regulator